MATYVVFRAFRMPRTGGVYVPYRIYEVGVEITTQDMDVWELGGEALSAEITFLTGNGTLQLVSAAPASAVAEHPVS